MNIFESDVTMLSSAISIMIGGCIGLIGAKIFLAKKKRDRKSEEKFRELEHRIEDIFTKNRNKIELLLVPVVFNQECALEHLKTIEEILKFLSRKKTEEGK